MAFSTEDMEQLSESVNQWAKATRKDVIAEMDALGIQASSQSKSRIPLRRAIKSFVSKKYGMPSKVTFKFPRHGVFIHKGVGRGTKASEAGTTIRQPAPFLDPVIERNLDDLANMVADHQGTLIINALTIQ